MPGAGPAQVESVMRVGPLRRLHVAIAGQGVEVLRQADAWTPDVGQSCGIDLSRAKVYSARDQVEQSSVAAPVKISRQ